MVRRRHMTHSEVDPAYWEARLAEDGILSQEAVEAGVFGGVPGAEEVRVVPIDAHERSIVDKHRTYGKDGYSVVSPSDERQLNAYVDELLKERGAVSKVSVHTSCIDDGSGAEYDSIIVAFKDGTQVGLNTRQMGRYSRDRFITRMARVHNVGVLER